MSEKVNTDLNSLKLIFNKNRIYIFPIVVVLISIILFFQFIIPQFKGLMSIIKDSNEISSQLKIQKANATVLSNISEEVLASQLTTLNLALPASKDFIGILNSIYSSAQKTGVSLGSFSFDVGDLSKTETGKEFPVAKLSIPVKSGVKEINNFVGLISETFPLSEINLIKMGNTSSVVNLSFFYKPVDESGYKVNARVKPISQKALDLINQLDEFGSAPAFSETPTPSATPSATPSSTPVPSLPVATPSITQ
jgi:Tfp pilus assembly protein PilO